MAQSPLQNSMTQPFIKASKVNTLTDARYFAARGVKWLGFSLDPANPSYLPPAQLQAIKEWIEGPGLVGEFGFQSAEEIAGAVQLLGLDAVQLAPFSDPSTLSQHLQQPIFQLLIPESMDALSELEQSVRSGMVGVQHFVMDFAKNGISWQQLAKEPQWLQGLQKLCERHELILDFYQLTTSDLEAMCSRLRGFGIQLSGSEEEKTGLKSFDELDEIFDWLLDAA